MKKWNQLDRNSQLLFIKRCRQAVNYVYMGYYSCVAISLASKEEYDIAKVYASVHGKKQVEFGGRGATRTAAFYIRII